MNITTEQLASSHVLRFFISGENGETIKISLEEKMNNYFEGEGAAAKQLLQHNKDNCLLISNDTDALLYALLAGVSRERTNQVFENEFWLQLNFSQTKTDVCGTKNRRASEFWDVNKLIYAIEEKLQYSLEKPSPIYSLLVVYLAGGSDMTDKWFQKTHNTFLKAWLQNQSYIGQMVCLDQNVYDVNFEAYRRLLHAACITKNIDPRDLTFEQVRNESKHCNNVRLHIPQEDEIHEIGLCVCGTFRYMTSYFHSTDHIDWSMYGFTYDDTLKTWMPKRICLSTTSCKPQTKPDRGNTRKRKKPLSSLENIPSKNKKPRAQKESLKGHNTIRKENSNCTLTDL